LKFSGNFAKVVTIQGIKGMFGCALERLKNVFSTQKARLIKKKSTSLIKKKLKALLKGLKSLKIAKTYF
jgi:hypothetical protein